MQNKMELKINGKDYVLDVEPTMTLLELIRDRLGLTGAKDACGEGVCGACTVIMDGKAVNSCLVLAREAQGSEIITIEGLGKGSELDPLQEAFIQHGAVHCGYCMPGMILTAKALLDENPHPTTEQIKEAISGNICRCNGYVEIIEAIQLAANKEATE